MRNETSLIDKIQETRSEIFGLLSQKKRNNTETKPKCRHRLKHTRQSTDKLHRTEHNVHLFKTK